jgi:hypothetical protein
MSDRAQVRIRAGEERLRAIADAEWAASEAARFAAAEVKRLEGPPGGCADCWYWADIMYGYQWHRRASMQPGPPPPGGRSYGPGTGEADWCYHPCHGEDGPAFCGAIACA